MLQEIAEAYAEAWTSHSPAAVAAFFTPDGQISINRGAPSVGKEGLKAMAAGFYAEFPDIAVTCDRVERAGDHAVFHWTFDGHHVRTGAYVKVSGWEEWDLDADLKITASRGWFDAADYERQIGG